MDTLTFADVYHKPLSLKVGDKVYITLGKGIEPGYGLNKTMAPKLSEQPVGPFPIREVVRQFVQLFPIGRLFRYPLWRP